MAIDIDPVSGQFKVVEEIQFLVLFDEEKAAHEALASNHYNPERWAREGISQESFVDKFSWFLNRHKMLKLTSKKGKPYLVARVAAHNAVFDCGFILATFSRFGKFVPADAYRPLCTMQRALWWFVEHPEEEHPLNYRLETLCKKFNVNVTGNLHDAMVDVKATASLLSALIA